MAGEIKINDVSIATESGGTVTLGNATLGSTVVLGTNASPIASNLVLAAGNGIDFSAASGSAAGSSSAVLDDYEEGTWTPVVSDNSTGGNIATLDSNSTDGVYTKIGDIVYFRFSIVLSSKGSMASGNTVFIQGFPFQSALIPGNWYNPFPVIIRNITFSGYVQFHQTQNETYGYFRKNVSGATGDNIYVSDLASNSAMQVAGFYKVS